jgi:hypothetical protein
MIVQGVTLNGVTVVDQLQPVTSNLVLYYDPTQWFDGKIGVTRLYNAALTGAQVLQNYTANRSTYGL